jgi:hypothetical protein
MAKLGENSRENTAIMRTHVAAKRQEMEAMMKIRLIGSADLVRAWGAEFERSYGIKAAEYPSRYNRAHTEPYIFAPEDQLRTDFLVRAASFFSSIFAA